MFKPMKKTGTSATVTIHIEGENRKVPMGISAAAAVVGYAGEKDCRTSFVTGEKRAPYCFIGVCHDCLMEIDGKPNQQGCQIQVEEGMRIKKQHIQEGR